jgi:Flp pilus assembly protein TadG
MMPAIRFHPPPVLARLVGDRRGVSAVEFALLAPLMIALYLGCVEISDGVAAQRKVSLTAAALANLTAQVTSISQADMTNILDASGAIIKPYSAANISMSVSCLKIDANKNVSVKWSVARGGSPLSGSVTIPDALKVADSELVYAIATYVYTPAVGYTITGTLSLSDDMYMSPRISAPVYDGTACT